MVISSIIESMEKKKVLVILIGIILLGAFFRFYRITDIPIGLYPDEAMNGNNAVEALATGNFRIFYTDNNGREGLFINLQALAIKLFGNEPWALRVVSVLVGTLTIWGLYLVTKELFTKDPRRRDTEPGSIRPDSPTKTQSYSYENLLRIRSLSIAKWEFKISSLEIVALLGSFFLATSYWHLNFSRIGFRAITVPLFATFALYFLLRALRQGKIVDAAAAGLFIGLGFYTYIAFRFLPFVMAIPIVWYFWRWLRERKNQNGKPQKMICSPCIILLVVFVACVVALPIGWYFIQNPQDFFGRGEQVSIFSGKNPLVEFVRSNALTLGMLLVQGDCNPRHNFSCLPELHPFVAAFFLVGFLHALRSVRKNWRGEFENLVLLSWFTAMMLPATLTREGLPHALRAIGMIPPVMIFSALGAWQIGNGVARIFARQKIRFRKFTPQIARIQKESLILAIFFLLLIPLSTYRMYFIRWPSQPTTYEAFAVNQLHLGRYLRDLPQEMPKYVIGTTGDLTIYVQTVKFLTHTFLTEDQVKRNVHYLTPQEFIAMAVDEKPPTIIAFLDGRNRETVGMVKKKLPDFKPFAPSDFLILRNY